MDLCTAIKGYGDTPALARLLGVTPECIYHWLRGRRRPSPRLLPQLQSIFPTLDVVGIYREAGG